MRLTPVVSGKVRYVGYIYSTPALRVTFHGGRTYEY